MEPSRTLVYLATCKCNGKSYVGITSRSLRERSRKHYTLTKRGSNGLFHRALRKYGVEGFLWETVAVGLTWKDACQVERQLISFLGTQDATKGYNITAGGDGTLGFTLSPESRTKISQTLMSWHTSGDRKAAALRERISKSRKGFKASTETRKKLSEAHRGKTLAEEARLKVSASKQLYPEEIRIAAVSYAQENGFRAASRHFDIPRQTIRRWSKTRGERAAELESMRQRARQRQYGYAFPLVDT